MIKFDSELNMQKAKLAAKKAVLSTVLASSILATAGCSTQTQEDASKIESMDENYDNDLNNSIIKGDVNKLINDAYREGYKAGYYTSEQIQLENKINELAHAEGQLYVGITSKNGDLYYSGINSLMCVEEEVNNDYNYYVLECINEDGLTESEGKINYLDGTEIDHNFDLSNIKTTKIEDYINNYYGEDLLESHYRAYDEGSTAQFSKYDSEVFTHSNVYDSLSAGKTR